MIVLCSKKKKDNPEYWVVMGNPLLQLGWPAKACADSDTQGGMVWGEGQWPRGGRQRSGREYKDPKAEGIGISQWKKREDGGWGYTVDSWTTQGSWALTPCTVGNPSLTFDSPEPNYK